MSYLPNQLNLSDGTQNVDFIFDSGVFKIESGAYPVHINGGDVSSISSLSSTVSTLQSSLTADEASLLTYTQAISVPVAGTFVNPVMSFSNDGRLFIASGVIFQAGVALTSEGIKDVNGNEMTNQIATLQTAVSNIQASQTSDESNLSSLQSTVSSIQSAQTSDESNISSLQDSVSALQSLTANLSVDETNLSNLTSRVSAIANYINAAFGLTL
jgi:hypothetical protein